MKQRWKVLIADDEPIIRLGIRNAVDWDSLGMEAVAEAEDGEEVLELAVRHAIHLLLVDLNMPIMNGLTLMKHVRERLPDCRIVIITGHDEFAYAQEAIRLDVDEYILKPVNPEQLNQVMARVGRELETAAMQKEHMEAASRQIAKNLPLLRERFCLEWIEGGLTEAEIEEQLQFLHLPAECPNALAIIRWTDFSANQPLMRERDRQLLLFAIENIASELLAPYRPVIFRDPGGLIVALLWHDLPESVFTEIENAVRIYLKIAVTIHAEPVQGGLAQVCEAYRQCKAAVYQEMPVSPIVRRAKQYIRDHYGEPDLTLESMAQALQVSPVYLSQLIRQELGIPFVAYVTQLRIRKAIQLLNATDLPIHEIAERVGYETQHYFSTAFKKVTGVSPNQYRKGGVSPDDAAK